ncbi:unnamed protein product [Caenorhabditis auriculariae]|uniref:Protein kinase domain-containing protein n=1 Tax=Caenorhabditis auriculariae TaxID=2777116 RepID=A0A8S1HJQ3_9PELO|nr:unnamed protein product [Caenorhabditis auriculariae]
MGRGGYGVVYEVALIEDPKQRFACKAEKMDNKNSLQVEWKLMSILKEKGSKHALQGVEIGRHVGVNFIVMDLLGPTLSDLRRRTTSRTLTLFSTTVVAIQMFDAIREIHDVGYVHRDVKPSNFAIGLLGSSKEIIVHIIDFGISRNIYKITDGAKQLRKPRKRVPFRGTMQYCSLNVHNRVDQGPHDDLWSWLYTTVELLLGDLPWHGLEQEQTRLAKAARQDELLEKCPEELRFIRGHLDALAINKAPLYEEIRETLASIFFKNKFTWEMKLDWQAGGKHEESFHHISHKPSSTEGPVELLKILNLPQQAREITENRLTVVVELFDIPSSVSETDDTVAAPESVPEVEPPKPTKQPKMGPPKTPLRKSKSTSNQFKLVKKVGRHRPSQQKKTKQTKR